MRSCGMIGTTLIKWIDRQYESAGAMKAQSWLGLLVAAPWLVALLFDKEVFAVTFAAVWSVVWTGLFVWRAGPWLSKLDKRWQRKRRR